MGTPVAVLAGTAASGVPEQPRSGWLRWGGSFGLVLGLHGVALIGLLLQVDIAPPPSPPPAAIMIDLAPAAPPPAPPAPPKPVAQPEPPPPSPPLPEPEPEPPPPAVKPEVPLPPPKIEPKPKPPERKPEQPKPKPPKMEPKAPPPPKEAPPEPPSRPSAPTQMEAPPAPKAAAPERGPAQTAAAAQAKVTWQGLLLGHLERHKRYPRKAQWRRQQGVAYVRFTIDRKGHVLRLQLERSSGHAALDEETLALIKRAEPLPPPPPEVPGDTLDLVVPVQFYLRR